MIFNLLNKEYIKLFLLILISIILDYLLISAINNPPLWDQGYHLSNVFKMSNILQGQNTNLSTKIDQLLIVTDSYRGPLTYFLSALFLNLFRNSYQLAYLSNQIFSIICIFSIYQLGKILKDKSLGIWGALIFTFSSLIIHQRTDYLIDLSLTSFTCLNLLFFTNWYLNNKKNSKYAIFSGFTLGLVFLTKPTGISLFFLPFLIILIKKFKIKKNFLLNINEFILFISSFLLIIFPWFSKHWLTIITSTINAWNWGLNYQEGLSFNSINSWLYFFKSFPKIFGYINFSIFAVIFVLEKISLRKLLKINLKEINKNTLWMFIFIFNCYLVVSLMSTKDIRFILPIYPVICIYIAQFITESNYKFFTTSYKKIIIIISIIISLFTSHYGKFFNTAEQKLFSKWPHFEIIKNITEKNSYLTSTLAILPDTKEINTFNLEAEASRQGEYVSVRQVVSNENTYKEDLKYFDWFLVKTKDQGVMSSESKNKLNEYLLNNNSFLIDKEWDLPDESKLYLLRRKSINSSIKRKDCATSNQSLKIKQINNGINISYFGDGNSISSSSLLLDFISKDFTRSSNIVLANGFLHESFDEESCYYLSQNVPIDFPKNKSNELLMKARLLRSNGDITPLDIGNQNLIIKEKLKRSNSILMANKIKEVEKLGIFLREGKFKNIFDLVGVLNQSDPKQIYLKRAEIIYLQRYKEKEDLKDLYSVLISQILQRKALEAKDTVNIILKKDQNNGNTYLTKSIINIFLLDKKDARKSIEKTIQSEKSIESSEILEIANGITYFLEMKITNALQSFR